MASVKTVLVSLRRSVSPNEFIEGLQEAKVHPLILARAVEWMVLPTFATHLLAHDWDFLLVLEDQFELPERLSSLLEASYTVHIRLPSPLAIKEPLNLEKAPPTPFLSRPLRSLNSQYHQTTPSLLAFAASELCPKGPVSMLNFVSYQGMQGAESYQKYVSGVGAGPMARTGGRVKLNGVVNSQVERGEWDKCLIAEYPSLKHFNEMGCNPDYQELNFKYRVPALRDLAILMTTEVDLSWTIPGSKKVKPEVPKL